MTMPKEKTRTRLILVSAKCFSLTLTLTLIFFLTLITPAQAVTVSGLPSWLEPAVSRSLNAVWNEIPDDVFTDREGTLKVVSERLFPGYSVDVRPGGGVIFSSTGSAVVPEVRIIQPELRERPSIWFKSDILGMSDEIAHLAGQVPQEVLTWADEELKLRVSEIVDERLPGWDFSQNINFLPGQTVITLTFRPSPEMVLAVKTEFYSRTIPAMFQSELDAKVLPLVSEIVGLPLKWVSKHAEEIESETTRFLEDRNTVENMRAGVSVKFKAGRISVLNANVGSKDLRFTVWVSAYAGLDGKYPEAGAFFGFRPLWRVNDRYNFAPEFYAELIFSLDDFGVTGHFGGRFEFLQNFWAGIEYEVPVDEIFVRLEYIPVKIRRPYARWRFSLQSSEQEAELGYRIDEHISAGIYYDGDFGLRGIWNL